VIVPSFSPICPLLPTYLPSNQYFRFHSWVSGIPNLFPIQRDQCCTFTIWKSACLPLLTNLFRVLSPRLQLHELPSFFLSSLFSLFCIPVPHPSYFISLQLLCQNPLHRLRYLHHFQVHPFFRGVTFDPELLQKHPVNFVMETQDTQPCSSESMAFKDFDGDLESCLVHSISASPSLL
jgi:uncharacterized serine/threonine-protein kinase SgK494